MSPHSSYILRFGHNFKTWTIDWDIGLCTMLDCCVVLILPFGRFSFSETSHPRLTQSWQRRVVYSVYPSTVVAFFTVCAPKTVGFPLPLYLCVVFQKQQFIARAWVFTSVAKRKNNSRTVVQLHGMPGRGIWRTLWLHPQWASKYFRW